MSAAIDTLTEFRLQVSNKTSNVDLDNRIIKDVILCQPGEIKDWLSYNLEEEFIDKLVEQGSKMKDGLPCNYGHNYNNLGKGLGRIKNIRKLNGKAVGDLHIYEAADESPTHPGMGSYVLKQGAEDNKSIMMSIGFKHDGFYQYDKSGNKIKVRYWNSKGQWVPIIQEYGKLYIALKQLKKCDVVDEGAATDRFYNSSTALTSFMDAMHEPEFAQFLEDNYQSMTLLSEFFAKKTKPSFMAELKSFFNKEDKSMEKSFEEQVADLTEELGTKTTALSAAETKIKELSEKFEGLQNEITQFKATIVEKDAKIKELGEQSAGLSDTQDDVDTDTGGNKDKAYMKCPIQQNLMAKFQNK